MTNLITRSEDERIDQKLISFVEPEIVVIHHEDAEWVSLMRDSLRAALARAETAEAQLCRAREALEELRAAEEGQSIYNPIPEYKVAAHERWWKAHRNYVTALSASAPCPHEAAAKEMHRTYQVELSAHSSTTRNLREAEAEAKRLRRELSVAVASAKAMVSNEMVARLEIIYKEEVVGCTEHEMAILARFMEDFRSLARENREALDDILRRRTERRRG